jgi:2-aminoethylphosphonate-pyruvate transaminase
MGVRLQAPHRDRPKGLLEIGGVPLIHRSLETLLSCGVSRVVLVTGYRAAAYREFLRDRFPSVELRHNPEYARTGSMHSLLMADGAVAGPFLLLESDLLYEPRAVIELLRRPPGDHLLLSGATGQGDEVYAYGADGRLGLLSKARRTDLEMQGEFVGICRLGPELLAAMCRHYQTQVAFPSNYEYDACLSDLGAAHRLNLHRVDDLLWAEIDDEAQHRRAAEHLAPAIGRRPFPHAHPA